MLRFTSAALSLCLAAGHAFGADQPAQTQTPSQLPDPRCTVEGLTALKVSRENETGLRYTNVLIVRTENGQAGVHYIQDASPTNLQNENTLCSLSGNASKQVSGMRMDASW